MGPCFTSLCSVRDDLEEFTGVHTANSATTEESIFVHSAKKDSTRIMHGVFMQWLQAHSPFLGYQRDGVVSIVTGVVVDVSVHCEDAVKVGLPAASRWPANPPQRPQSATRCTWRRPSTIVMHPDLLLHKIN